MSVSERKEFKKYRDYDEQSANDRTKTLFFLRELKSHADFHAENAHSAVLYAVSEFIGDAIKAIEKADSACATANATAKEA